MTKLKNIVIYGAGGMAREIVYLIEDINRAEPEWNVLGHLDDDPSLAGKLLNNYKVLGDFKALASLPKPLYLVLGIAKPEIKEKIVAKIKQHALQIEYPVLIHPAAKVSHYSLLGPGTIVTADSIVSINTKLGYHVFLNFKCVISHDALIGDNSSLMNGVVISGNATLENKCYLGTNAVVLPGKTIGQESIIGAGAVVNNDIPAFATAVGVPAKVIKQRS